MHRLTVFSLSLISILAAVKVTAGQVKPAPGANVNAGRAEVIARGKYIVENVAMCEQCHTRRDENGKPDVANWLMGGPVQLQPTYPTKWAIEVPRIAGGPPGTDAEVIRELTTGISRRGTYLNPPMPQFRMTTSDAEAVLAYLKSLAR